MKKLMMAVAIVCAAVIAQAASFDWKTAKTGGTIYGPNGVALNGGTAYLFASTAAETVFTDWAAGTSLGSMSGVLDDQAVTTAGKIVAGTAFDTAATGTFDAIFAITATLDGKDYLFISDVASVVVPEVGTAHLQFAATAASNSGVLNEASAGYAGAGWYTQSIPEPTSALMLLVGLAGLALRRKQA